MNVRDTLKNMIISLSTNYITADAINNSTDLIRDLSFNSISIVQLVVNIENEFGFDFDDEMLGFEEIVIFQNLVEYIIKKMGGSR